MSNPFDVATIATPALAGIVRALSDRDDQTEAERLVKASSAVDVIMSFLPRDVIELTLAGQAVLFNELLADGAHDALRGMAGATKQRCHSTLVSMGRLVQGHLDRLEKRGNQPFRKAIVTPREECSPNSDVRAAENEMSEPPLPIVPSPPAAPGTEPRPVVTEELPVPMAPEQTTASKQTTALETTGALERKGAVGGVPVGETVAETSWLDEPYVQWLVETPADLAAAAAVMPATEPLAMMKAVKRESSPNAGRSGAVARDAEPALPRQPAGYPTARTMANAVASVAG
jgi:hypothetical protein